MEGTPCHYTTYDYSRADCDGLRSQLRDVLWEDIFKVGASGAAAKFYECECQVTPRSSPWLLAAFAAVIVHRNHFRFTNKITLLHLK